MKKRMLAALAAALWLIAALAAADDGEAQERARQERVDGYLAAQFGADWTQTVAAYEDHDLDATAEDGTLFAILAEDGRNTLFVLDYEDGEQVSAYAYPGALRQDEASLLAAVTDERDGVRATLAESEMEGARFTAVCAASMESCALTVFSDWMWEIKTPEEIGICAYRALAEGGKRTTVEMPRWSDGAVCYEAEPARGEIAGWAQMPRPRTLTLVPVGTAGNEYPEAAMEFTLD